MKTKALRLLWASSVCLLMACTPGRQVADWGSGPRASSCRQVAVQNDSYPDVRVYIDRRRVGFVPGHSTAQFRVCHLGSGQPVIRVVPMAGRGYLVEYHGSWPLAHDVGLAVIIGISPAHSYARPY